MSFKSLLTDSVDITVVSGTDWEGTPLYSTIASGISSRVEFENRQVINNEGEQVVSNATIYLSPPEDFTLNAGDQLVYDSQNFTVISVNKVKDSTAMHHYEIMTKTDRRLG